MTSFVSRIASFASSSYRMLIEYSNRRGSVMDVVGDIRGEDLLVRDPGVDPIVSLHDGREDPDILDAAADASNVDAIADLDRVLEHKEEP